MKVMVVEDDAALREIYGIRITAEGYVVVTAGDGEEALAVAAREKPDLILSDVMMPKISGFDMLDILKSTPELANIKVVMMTALSGGDQRVRGESLGADRYLVKSQVGIEDVVNVIHEVLGDRASVNAPATPAAPTVPAPTPASTAQPAEAMPTPPSTSQTTPPSAPQTTSPSTPQATSPSAPQTTPPSQAPAPSMPNFTGTPYGANPAQ